MVIGEHAGIIFYFNVNDIEGQGQTRLHQKIPSP